ncbi:hypothetical protein [uncultured Veillonella sp.]|uniref:hypothetical protein n=1 Tax=uncultured Veillonella sp. TaxID=159268 RepID=UPI002597EA87|nr:hypothetical protein [uncultured Veillonella sp.]
MLTLMSLLIFLLFIWTVLVFIKPNFFARFLKSKPRLKAFGILILSCLLFSVLSNTVLSPEEQAQRELQREFKANKFAAALSLDNINQANDIENFLKTLDITDIHSIKHDKKLDNPNNGITGYHLTNGDYPNITLYMNPNKTVQAVLYKSKALYKDGTVYNKITNVALTSKQKTMMRLATEKAVTIILKAPKTADFCNSSDYEFSINNGIGTITGYVDAQNSFGAMIRSYFTAEYDMKQEKMLHLTFDGREVF